MSETLNIEIPLEETFTLDMMSDSLNCFSDESGSATVSCSGGFGPYNYNWNSSDEITQVLSALILILYQGYHTVSQV